jgi:hypothetical protein
MVRYVSDRTGRFSQRPHYKPGELDRECESIITGFLKDTYGDVRFPVSTDDLTRLIERDTEDLDLYADLKGYGPKVEGLTAFKVGSKPSVKISEVLAADDRYENRLRTTLTHEYGHVRFHAYLWELEPPQPNLLSERPDADKQICKRDDIVDAAQTDWMEWQAGYVSGAILMPASRTRRLVSEYQESHGLFGVLGHAGPHGQALIAEVQAAFQVSADAARVRLFKLDVLGEADAGPALFTA